MLTVIAGMSASGKSAYAEKRALELADGGALYYVATMEPYGEEGQRRIERHRRLRAGKGFQTIECCRHIEKAADGIDAAERGEATVLVECLSNLLANEMFPPAEAEGVAALPQAGKAYDAAQRVQRDAAGSGAARKNGSGMSVTGYCQAWPRSADSAGISSSSPTRYVRTALSMKRRQKFT